MKSQDLIFKANLIISKLRILFAKFFNLLFLNKRLKNLPNGIVRSIEEVLYDEKFSNRIIDKKLLLEPKIERYIFGENYPPYFRTSKAFQSKFIYEIKNVTVSPKSGLASIDVQYLLQESVGSMGRILGWGNMLEEFLLPNSKEILEGRIIVCPDTGYYHWLLEVLPNLLHCLKEYPDAKFLIYKDSSKYITDMIQILRKNIDLKVLESRYPVQVQSFVMATYEEHSGFVRKEDVIILRENFLSSIETKKRFKRKIYISRRKAKKRKIANELAFEKEIVKYGFEIVFAENLNFEEQIKLYSNSEFIVAPHGAGLANIVWCNPKAMLLEIFPKNIFNDCYARLAYNIGMLYEYITCISNGEQGAGEIPIEQTIEILKEKTCI